MIDKVINNKYRIIEELETGGQATIYKAEDTRLQGRLVVIKVIDVPTGGPKTSLGKQTLKRFEAEAALTAKLRHVQIVKVNDYGLDEENQVAWMAQDYLDGESLKDLIDRGPVNFARAREIVMSLARVLEYLHMRGIVHRDIKPSNIFLQNDIPMIIDLGLAQDPYQTLKSIPGQKVGTPAYMAPELLDEKKFEEYQYSPSRDWWGLGCVAFELFTGKKIIEQEETSLINDAISRGKEQARIDAVLEGHPGLQLVKGLLNRNPEARIDAGHKLLSEPRLRDPDTEPIPELGGQPISPEGDDELGLGSRKGNIIKFKQFLLETRTNFWINIICIMLPFVAGNIWGSPFENDPNDYLQGTIFVFIVFMIFNIFRRSFCIKNIITL